MAERVILHVGTMKSGTSYLQTLLYDRRRELARAGVLVPMPAWGRQVEAVRQGLARPQRPRPQWRRLVRDVAAHDGTAVISVEFLGPARPGAAQRIVADLGAPVTDVVITCRDLTRTVVSLWQETIQNGRSWTWTDYLTEVAANAPGAEPGPRDTTTPGGTFWRQQHVVRMVDDWASAVGLPAITVVTLPPPGAPPAALADRFATATGLTFAPPVEVRTANASLGLASVLALRQVNELLDAQGLVYPAGFDLRKRVLAKQVLGARRHDEPRLGLDVPEWTRVQTSATVAALRERGLEPVGDWADLEPLDVPGVQPADVPDALVAAAAIEGLAGVLADRITAERAEDEREAEED